jgi:hypothetical protein
LWYDTVNQQLKVWTSSAFLVVGPAFSSATGTAGAIPETINDSGGGPHLVTTLYVNNSRQAIVSLDSAFTPASPINTNFPTIYPGITVTKGASSVLSGNVVNTGNLTLGAGGATTSDTAEWNINPARTATGSGVGDGTANRVIVKLRSATGEGLGTSTTLGLHVAPRTATGSGQGTQTATRLIKNIRTATGSGTGTQTATSIRGLLRACTGTGLGTQTAEWDKSHIFRVPYNYQYVGGFFNDKDGANRLGAYIKTNVRARNLYKLTDNSYTIVDQRDLGQVKKLWHGGRDHFLTPAEQEELTTDGFGAYIT